MTPSSDPRPLRLLVIGAGGHARVVIDVARAAGFDPVAALDPSAVGAICNDVEVVGSDDLAAEMFSWGLTNATVAIGDNALRARIAARLTDIGFTLPSIIHPSAIVSRSARLGAGTVVMPLAVINASAVIGGNVIVNSGAIVEHDCLIGDGAHIAPGSRLGGTVSVGPGTLIGIGSVVRPGAKVGANAIIGAGSTVIGNIESHRVATGSPAKEWANR